MALLGLALNALGELWARSNMRRGAKSKHLEHLATTLDACVIWLREREGGAICRA
jgi:hypothetical protein